MHSSHVVDHSALPPVNQAGMILPPLHVGPRAWVEAEPVGRGGPPPHNRTHASMAGAMALIGLLASLFAPELSAVPIPNGGFEDGSTGWAIPDGESMSSVVQDPTAPGGRALRVLDTRKDGGSSASSAVVQVTRPGIYQIRGRYYPVSGTGLGIYVHLLDATRKRLTREPHVMGLGGTDQRWLPFQGQFVVLGSAAYLQVWIHSYNASVVDVYIDDLRIDMLKELTMDLVKDMETIKERLHGRAMASAARASGVLQLADRLQDDGRWADIDYTDRTPGRWLPAGHISRLRTLAMGYTHPDNEAHSKPEIRNAFFRAYDHWVEKDYTCPNWWYNVIGVPMTLYEALILMEGELDRERMQAGVRILERAELKMTGQNLVWVARITVARGCLIRDPMLVTEAFGRIAKEIRITTQEGVQADASFYQHGAQLYSGGYGRGFSVDCASFAELASGTRFQFPQDKVDVLSFYLLDGQQWMVRGRNFDHSVRGREISRNSVASARSLVNACRDMVKLGTPREQEFEAFASRIEGDPLKPETPLIGNRHFWRADLMAHHRQGYYASVRFTSPRLLQSETCNSENLHGELLADGVNYLYRRGDEYDRIFPVWDWRRLPGITCEMRADPPGIRNGVRGKRAFAGGCSDGLYGLAAMDFERDRLTARKAWFFFDNVYVCLGADITGPDDTEVATSINQCLSRGDAFCGERLGAPTKVADDRTLTGPAWFHHDEVGYAVAGPATIQVANRLQHGSWHDINHTHSKNPLDIGVFSLGISHGKGSHEADYEYIVAPGISVDAAPALLTAPPVDTLANTASIQAVTDRARQVTEIVFWTGGELRVPEVGVISVDQPVVLLARQTDTGLTLAVANPKNEPMTVVVGIGAKYSGDECSWDADANRTVVNIDLPDGPEAGQSVVRNLVRP